MGIYKEGHHFLMGFAKRQIRVYPDKDIHGIIVTGPKSPSCLELRDGFNEEMYFGGLKQYRKEHRSKDIVSVNILMYIPWEGVGYVHWEPSSRCSRWEITYVHDKKHNIHYVSFTEQNVTVVDTVIWK